MKILISSHAFTPSIGGIETVTALLAAEFVRLGHPVTVVTQTLAAEGGGAWHEYVGGYTDWLQQRRTPVAAGAAKGGGSKRSAGGGSGSVASGTTGAGTPKSKTKLSYKDQRELAALPDEIEALEREQSELNALMSSADYHRRGPDQIRDDRARSAQIEALLLAKFDRWESLEQARK